MIGFVAMAQMDTCRQGGGGEDPTHTLGSPSFSSTSPSPLPPLPIIRLHSPRLFLGFCAIIEANKQTKSILTGALLTFC